MTNSKTRCRGLKRLTAFLLSVICILGILPMQALAASPGQKASSWFGDYYTGYDGEGYYSPAPTNYMVYHENGTTEYRANTGGGRYRHYMLTDSGGHTHSVYCIESGVDYTTSDNAYTSESGNDSRYLELLPSTARQGIKLTSVYGWKPGASLPVSGINEDDYKIATQVLLWEYQQQIRTDPYSRHANGPVSANEYFSIIDGRPAEKAYNWILKQVASHSKVPSFTASSKGDAPQLELKWDTEKKVYTLTVTDTNSLNIDLETLAGSGVSVVRKGNSYTFTSKKMITDPVTFEFRKDIPVAEDMLIWGRPGYQTMMTGASDPVSFFVKIKTETYGTAKIIKTSEDGIVEGITFRISGKDILGNEVDQNVTTGKNGQVEEKFLPGTYLAEEIAVDRYVTPSAQYITIESGQTSTVHFSNILKKFRVHVEKTDTNTGTAQGDASLAGAVYGLYNNGDLVDQFTTDANGEFLTGYYVCGENWTLREIEPSTGYLLDETVYAVGASPTLYEVELNTAENIVKETVISGNIQLIKHMDELDPDVSEEENADNPNEGIIETPEAGAAFEIYLTAAGSYDGAKESERDLLTTDENGYAASKQLPYGRYTVHQIEGQDGKGFIPDFTVFVSENGYTYSYILNNRTITSRLKVEKCDAETGKIIPLTGTGFRIKDLSAGEFISQEIYYPNPETLDTFYVSDEGWLMLPEPLPAGAYELYEVAAPEGYVLADEPVPFTIDGSEAVVTVTQYNMPQKGQLTITKSGEIFSSVQENDGLYQPVYEVSGLPGAVYDVIADEDIYTGDGTLRVQKDTVVETLTTGEDGTAQSGLLYLGHYRLEEKQAPEGMVLNKVPEYIELIYAGETVEVTQAAAGLYDERQKVSIDLLKSLETDELFGLGTGTEYQDISFGLYAAENLTAADGSVIPKDGLLEAVSVSPEEEGGYGASFITDLPFGSYYVQERTTNEAYILSDQKYPAVFEYAGQETALVTISVNDGNTVSNELMRGRVDGKKYGEAQDGEDPIGLEGAVIGLFSPDTEEFTEENALLTAVTGEDGSFCFEEIPFGHWIVKEISAPELYTVSPEEHHVYIAADGQTVKIRVDNNLIRGNVQIRKTEAVAEPSAAETGKEEAAFMRTLEGAVFDLYEDVNGNQEFDEEDQQIGTLTESEGGLHTAKNLLAKGYFIKEGRAPEGYVPDENTYFFEITEDGQTVIVENGEAGQGFINEAQRGNLKIVKDSSDGRKDGFAIEVKSKDGTYCETFTTPENGVIEVNGLRAGIYTVTEVSNRASQDYIIPDAAIVEIKAGETATVQLFNEKPGEETDHPETAENKESGKTVPQTGDDSLTFLYGILLAAGLAGMGISAFFLFRQRKNRRQNKGRKASVITALGICGVLAAGCGILLVRDLFQYIEGARAYEKLADNVELAEQLETDEPDPSAMLPKVDFDVLKETCPDIIGWLNLPGTDLNYPVVQAEDNEYYLDHLPDGSNSKVGALFSDYENRPDFSDRSTIIYGHNMRDGSMFAMLNEYDSQAFYEENPQMYLVTPGEGYVAEIFAAFEADPAESGTNTSPWRLEWKDDGDYTTWLKVMVERSEVDTEGTVTCTDRIVTLSTCTPGGRSRFLVMGKLTEIEE